MYHGQRHCGVMAVVVSGSLVLKHGTLSMERSFDPFKKKLKTDIFKVAYCETVTLKRFRDLVKRCLINIHWKVRSRFDPRSQA